MKTLFGGSDAKSSGRKQSTGGFSALPADIQEKYRGLLGNVEGVIGSASQYFSPMDLTEEELLAEELINLPQDPNAYRQQIETFLSPYRGIITDDINRAFEDEYSALKSRASEAGAFGGSRMRGRESDLEESRLRSIAAATQNQYNVAQNQLQQTIGNLLGFGGLERGIDLEQRMALPRALGFASDIYSPLLNASTSTQRNVQRQSGGLMPALSTAAGLATGIGGIGAGMGLWGGLDPFTGIRWASGRL